MINIWIKCDQIPLQILQFLVTLERMRNAATSTVWPCNVFKRQWVQKRQQKVIYFVLIIIIIIIIIINRTIYVAP